MEITGHGTKPILILVNKYKSALITKKSKSGDKLRKINKICKLNIENKFHDDIDTSLKIQNSKFVKMNDLDLLKIKNNYNRNDDNILNSFLNENIYNKTLPDEIINTQNFKPNTNIDFKNLIHENKKFSLVNFNNNKKSFNKNLFKQSKEKKIINIIKNCEISCNQKDELNNLNYSSEIENNFQISYSKLDNMKNYNSKMDYYKLKQEINKKHNINARFENVHLQNTFNGNFSLEKNNISNKLNLIKSNEVTKIFRFNSTEKEEFNFEDIFEKNKIYNEDLTNKKSNDINLVNFPMINNNYNLNNYRTQNDSKVQSIEKYKKKSLDTKIFPNEKNLNKLENYEKSKINHIKIFNNDTEDYNNDDYRDIENYKIKTNPISKQEKNRTIKSRKNTDSFNSKISNLNNNFQNIENQNRFSREEKNGSILNSLNNTINGRTDFIESQNQYNLNKILEPKKKFKKNIIEEESQKKNKNSGYEINLKNKNYENKTNYTNQKNDTLENSNRNLNDKINNIEFEFIDKKILNSEKNKINLNIYHKNDNKQFPLINNLKKNIDNYNNFHINKEVEKNLFLKTTEDLQKKQNMIREFDINITSQDDFNSNDIDNDTCTMFSTFNKKDSKPQDINPKRHFKTDKNIFQINKSMSIEENTFRENNFTVMRMRYLNPYTNNINHIAELENINIKGKYVRPVESLMTDIFLKKINLCKNLKPKTQDNFESIDNSNSKTENLKNESKLITTTFTNNDNIGFYNNSVLTENNCFRTIASKHSNNLINKIDDKLKIKNLEKIINTSKNEKLKFIKSEMKTHFNDLNILSDKISNSIENSTHDFKNKLIKLQKEHYSTYAKEWENHIDLS